MNYAPLNHTPFNAFAVALAITFTDLLSVAYEPASELYDADSFESQDYNASLTRFAGLVSVDYPTTNDPFDINPALTIAA